MKWSSPHLSAQDTTEQCYSFYGRQKTEAYLQFFYVNFSNVGTANIKVYQVWTILL